MGLYKSKFHFSLEVCGNLTNNSLYLAFNAPLRFLLTEILQNVFKKLIDRRARATVVEISVSPPNSLLWQQPTSAVPQSLWQSCLSQACRPGRAEQPPFCTVRWLTGSAVVAEGPRCPSYPLPGSPPLGRVCCEEAFCNE